MLTFAAGIATAILWLALGTQPTLPELKRGNVGWSGDYRSFHLPNAELAASRLAEGEVPLWNPSQGAGGPFLATLQPGVLYPLNALRLVLSAHHAALVLAFFHVALAFFFTGSLARGLGAGALGSVVAGLCYVGSVAFVGTIWAPMQHYAAAWAPGLLLAVDRALTSPSRRPALFLAVCVAMPLLASWPQSFVMMALSSALFAAPLLLARGWRDWHAALRAIAVLTLGVLAGLLLAAPQLLPSLELLSRSPRAVGSLVEAQSIFVRGPHDPAAFLRALLRSGFNGGVPGWAALLLAPLAVALRGPRRGRSAALLGVGALALLASFPNDVPIYGWLHGLPIVGDFRFPYRYRIVTTLALAVTAGVGASNLQRALLHWPRTASLAGVVAISVCLFGLMIPVYRSVLPFARSMPADPSVAEVLEESAAQVIPPERGRVYRAHYSRKLRPPQRVAVLYDLEPLTLTRTAQMLTFFETGRARTILTLEESRETQTRRRGKKVRKRRDPIPAPFYGSLVLPREGARAPILDLFSTALIVADDPPDWLDRRYRRVSPKGAKRAVFENPHALPRAYAVTRALPMPQRADVALNRMIAPDFDLRRVALVEGVPPGLLMRSGAEAPLFRGEVVIAEYAPERVVLHAQGPQSALVILTDAHYPGWVATLDGEEVPLLRANWNFRAVFVPAGSHDIEMRYRPASFRWGVGLALLSAVGCVLACVWRREGRISDSCSENERSPQPRVLRELALHPFARSRQVEIDGTLWLHKRFRIPGLPRAWGAPLAAVMMRHELENCALLEGLPGTATRARPLDRTSFVREWVEGRDLRSLKRSGARVSDGFFDELRDILDGIHARGLAYNDLEKKDNVLVTPAGSPVLIDYQIGLREYRGRYRWLQALSRRVLGELRHQDMRYLYKMKSRYRPDLMTAEEAKLARERSPAAAFYHPAWWVLHGLKRLLIPKGSKC